MMAGAKANALPVVAATIARRAASGGFQHSPPAFAVKRILTQPRGPNERERAWFLRVSDA